MTIFFYHIFLFLFRTGASITSLFNKKTKKWLQGRRCLFEKLEAVISNNTNIVWMHCSSLGEFEQGRPVLEQLRLQYPASKFLLTFFSPSGY
ncbi:MAG TPA: glycosyltransferase N-terminal domain-containing protein, partial [Chitinophagaceae bacterium]|nr:glycosyltransferase N-terminal domain-containing protein [Chitinophagaceae bacterium]